MSQFHKQSFAHRFQAMGDEAEGKFEEVHVGGWVRYGLNRPPVSMSMLTPKIRYTPDYLCSGYLLEVQGVGGDRKLKLKVDKAMALQQWSQDIALKFFVWDSKLKRHTYLEWSPLWLLLPYMPIKSFPEGKPYWEIDIDENVWAKVDA